MKDIFEELDELDKISLRLDTAESGVQSYYGSDLPRQVEEQISLNKLWRQKVISILKLYKHPV